MLFQFEIIIFFFAFLDLAPFRTELAGSVAIFVGQKLFLANAVKAGLLVLVDFSLVVQTLQHSLYTFLVKRIGRGRPGVVAHIEFVPEGDELLGHPGHEFLWSHAFFLG